VARYIEAAGIPVVQICTVVGTAEQTGVKRIVRGWGVPFPLGTPWLTPEEEEAQRLATVERALDALQTTPAEPTLFWPNFGNVFGDQISHANPMITEITGEWKY